MLAQLVKRSVRLVLNRLPILRTMFTIVLPQRLVAQLTDRLMAGRAERIYMHDTMLPKLAECDGMKLLFIGCRRYTQQYNDLFSESPVEYWTIDKDPEVARFGAPGGTFIVGWSHDPPGQDPDRVDAICEVFRQGTTLPLDPNVHIQESGHRFNSYTSQPLPTPESYRPTDLADDRVNRPEATGGA